jgi:hypothetical protein
MPELRACRAGDSPTGGRQSCPLCQSSNRIEIPIAVRFVMGINAAILAKHCMGVITRCVAPLRLGMHRRYATRPSARIELANQPKFTRGDLTTPAVSSTPTPPGARFDERIPALVDPAVMVRAAAGTTLAMPIRPILRGDHRGAQGGRSPPRRRRIAASALGALALLGSASLTGRAAAAPPATVSAVIAPRIDPPPHVAYPAGASGDAEVTLILTVEKDGKVRP